MRSNTEAFEYSGVATRLPAQDLNRARSFYEEKLGLEPIEERAGGLLYRCGSGFFCLVYFRWFTFWKPHTNGI